jgi:hypothetical protein
MKKVDKTAYGGDSQCLVSKHYLGEEIKKDEMGGVCSMYE